GLELVLGADRLARGAVALDHLLGVLRPDALVVGVVELLLGVVEEDLAGLGLLGQRFERCQAERRRAQREAAPCEPCRTDRHAVPPRTRRLSLAFAPPRAHPPPCACAACIRARFSACSG